MATPKFPPPPRSAQNSSACSCSLTRRYSPGGDQVDGEQVVARETVQRREPAEPAAEGQTGHAGVRHRAAGRRQSEGLRLAVDVGPEAPPATRTVERRRIDVDGPHRRQVDHQSAVGHGLAGHVVPAAAHRHEKVVLAGEPHRGHDVGGAGAAHDRPRADDRSCRSRPAARRRSRRRA